MSAFSFLCHHVLYCTCHSIPCIMYKFVVSSVNYFTKYDSRCVCVCVCVRIIINA